MLFLCLSDFVARIFRVEAIKLGAGQFCPPVTGRKNSRIMIKLFPSFMAAMLILVSSERAQADICSYKPSKLMGNAARSVGAAFGSSEAAHAGLRAAGHYSIVHPEASLRLIESTAATAGVVGSIASSSGVAGTVGAIVSAPATAVVGGIALIGIGALEGVCYFKVESLTDPYEVRKVIESVAAQDDAVSIIQTDDGDAMTLTEQGETKTYLLRKLYISDGSLKHRNFGINTDLGPIVYIADDVEAVE